jgi:acyl carrier protein
MTATIEDDVRRIIATEMDMDPSRITRESTLKALEIPSLDAIEIIFKLEEHFDVTLPDRDPNFDTDSVGGLIEAVEQALAAKAQKASPATPAS